MAVLLWVGLAVGLFWGWVEWRSRREAERQQQQRFDLMKLQDETTGLAGRRSRVSKSSPSGLFTFEVDTKGRSERDEPRQAQQLARAINRKERGQQVVQPFTGSLVYAISYSDSAGVQTRRQIRIVKVEPIIRYDVLEGIYVDDASNIHAFCELRHAYRHFRSDRIVEMADAQTGEVIENPEAYLRQIATIPGSGNSDMAGDGFKQARKKALPGLKVLAWIALADRELSEAETDLLEDYVNRRDALSGKPSGEFHASFMRMAIGQMMPTRADADAALARMGSKERNLVFEHAVLLPSVHGAKDEAAAKRLNQLFLV